MIVVIEGPDLSGKSTLAKNLAKEMGFRYVKWPYEPHILKTCPDESGETFYKTLLMFKDQDMVMDRGFLSNMVYCEFMERQYDNSYIHSLIGELNPLIIHLSPSDETLNKRIENRDEQFVDTSRLKELKACYSKHSEEMRTKQGWNIIDVEFRDDVFIGPTPTSAAVGTTLIEYVKKLVSLSEPILRVRQDVVTNGQVLNVHSNYHGRLMTTVEKTFNSFTFNPNEYKGEYDDDYRGIMPRIEEVSQLLKMSRHHRGAVILNPKAENGDCVCLWHLLIRDSKFESFVYIRSSDIDRKLRQDIEMTTWVIRTVADRVGISSIGQCRVVQGSAHIYT